MGSVKRGPKGEPQSETWDKLMGQLVTISQKMGTMDAKISTLRQGLKQ